MDVSKIVTTKARFTRHFIQNSKKKKKLILSQTPAKSYSAVYGALVATPVAAIYVRFQFSKLDASVHLARDALCFNILFVVLT